MTRRRRRAVATWVAAGALALLPCGVATGPAAAANTEFNILAGADKTGQIDLLAIGPPGGSADIYEWIDGGRRFVRTVSLDGRFVSATGREYGAVLVQSLSRWRCDRRIRTFVAVATTTTGQSILSEGSQVRTPSCSRRFKLGAPARVRPGRVFRATVRDRWKLGGERPRLCVRAPGARRASCRGLPIPPGKATASRRLRLPAAGTWGLELRTSYGRTRRAIGVGVRSTGDSGRERSVLLLGDSIMNQLATPIGDRLGSRINTETLLNGGGRLTDRNFDWFGQARRRLRSLKPAVAAILVGGGDGFPLRVGGALVECCSEPWINEYAKRVVGMMRTLRRGGRTRVVWVLYPSAENPDSRLVLNAVNSAALRAAPRVRGVALADLNPAISPGFVYRQYATHRGRTIRIRAGDGMHFTLQGAGIAAAEIVRAIRRQL